MSTHTEALTRLALAPATGEAALRAKALALCKLVDAGDGSPVDRAALRSELQAVAATEALSSRGLEGVLAAISALERIDAADGLVWPSSAPRKRAPVGYWPYEDGDPHGLAALDWCDTQGQRDAWRARVEGEPPWRRQAGR